MISLFFSKTFSSLAFQSNKSKTLTHFKIIIKTILLNNSWHLEKTVYLVIKPNRLESVRENIKFTLCPWQNNYSYCSACNQYEISLKKIGGKMNANPIRTGIVFDLWCQWNLHSREPVVSYSHLRGHRKLPNSWWSISRTAHYTVPCKLFTVLIHIYP